MDEKLLQALQDYVATANSGKYKTVKELNSKFPELKGYDTQVLQDYVATANSGKYKTVEELNSKFPEFNVGKSSAVSSRGSKNTASTSTEPSQPSQPNIVSNPFGGQTQEQFIGEENARRIKSESAKPKTIDFSKGQVKADQRNQIEKDLSIKRAEKVQSKGTDVMNSLGAGVNQAYAGIAKIPRYIFEAFGVPQNLLADAVLNNAGEDLLAGIRTTGKEYDTLLNWMQGGTNNPLANSPLTALDRIGDAFQGRAEEFQAKQTKYDKGVFDSIASGDLGEAGAQIVNNIAQSAPSMLTMATTSGLSNAARLGSVGRTVINTLPFASSKANEIREDESIPDGIKPIYSGLYGLAEVIYDETFGTQALLNKVVETATKQGSREIAEKEVKDFAKGYLSSAFAKIKEPVTDVTKNVIEEMATQLSQNVLDKVVVDTNKDLMEGVLDAGIVALGTGVGLTSVNTIIRPSIKSSINQKNQQIENLSNDLDNTDIDDNSKEVILNKIANIKQEINSELTTEKENFDKLPETVKEEALEVSGRINTIENSLANPNISEDSKTTLTEEARILENRLNQITQQDATTQGNISENNQQQREGVVGQQQGQQENRQNEETVVSQAEAETGNSNSPVESGQIQEEITIGDVGNVPVSEKQTNSERAKKIADYIRSLKSGLDPRQTLGSGNIVGVVNFFRDGALETIATVIEAGGSIADGIASAVNYIREQQSLNNEEQTSIEDLRPVVASELLGVREVKTQPIQQRIRETTGAKRTPNETPLRNARREGKYEGQLQYGEKLAKAKEQLASLRKTTSLGTVHWKP